MLNETYIIDQLKTHFPHYIGDDAAVIPASGDHSYIISKDLLVEDIHFRRTYFSAADLAYKALQVNLSDIAAMGGKAQFVLCGIAIPVEQAQYAQDFLAALVTACKDAGVILIGGDTTRSTDKLFISISVIGNSATKNIRYRSTAKVGDVICSVGSLGQAHLGWIACEQSLPELQNYKNAFLRPKAKNDEGLWLGEKACVHSMMDISDGLFIDLKRLCLASQVAAHIELKDLQPAAAFENACDRFQLNAINVMLTGGEDYGLLCTVANAHYAQLAQDFKHKFGYALQCIGNIISGTDIHFTENAVPKHLMLTPFSHFGETL
jgi:thiamine-monophosphate kinase